MTTWNAAFEAAPADSDAISGGAGKIRELKTAISDRLELEMNFKAGTQPLLKAGIAAVLYSGTTVQIAALTGMSTGAFAWDTTLKVLKRYNGATRDTLDPDHGALSGKSDDDHPQYLSLDKAGQTIVQNVAVTAGATVDGVDISAHAAGTAKSQHTAGMGDHTHLSTGAEGGILATIGDWLSRSNNTAYAAATAGFVLATGSAHVYGYTDAANPPTTLRIEAASSTPSITMPVKKGDYWKVTGATAVWWIPIGA